MSLLCVMVETGWCAEPSTALHDNTLKGKRAEQNVCVPELKHQHQHHWEDFVEGGLAVQGRGGVHFRRSTTAYLFNAIRVLAVSAIDARV